MNRNHLFLKTLKRFLANFTLDAVVPLSLSGIFSQQWEHSRWDMWKEAVPDNQTPESKLLFLVSCVALG